MSGFNAMLAVQSIEAAKLYYDELHRQQAALPEAKRLKVATIFSFAPNEEQSAYGEIQDEELEPQDTAMPLSSKEFLSRAIDDYNHMFKTNFSTDGKEFQNYYRDLSKRVKSKEVDLLIVVGMFLTGFDAPTMNTLFVDKNLRYHGLIQAFSRTNRIFNKVKPFGNIVCFRDLEKATQEAIKTFGDTNKLEIILEKSFSEYMDGFVDQVTGIEVKGYTEVCREILERFPNPQEIKTENDKKEFVKLFGELLKLDNVLRNYDEFQELDKPISEGYLQDLKSAYVEIRDEFLNLKNYEKSKDLEVDLSDVEFEIELLKTDEINLDYILALIVEKSKNSESKEAMKAEVSRVIRSSIDIRAKEELVIGFINDTDLANLKDHDEIINAFYAYGKERKAVAIRELAESEKLVDGYQLFIDRAIQRGYAENSGTDLDEIIPPTSRRKGARELKKQQILVKVQHLVEIYKGI
ncbi:type I restriction and modification enzyme - subunit R C-terminal domain protein [Streptococcus constellatus subsp. pharyngis SK1060 = CCUG 46377]|nr:type I restriction and modification enzyme - subunit R C-terminal domain protein [Streptococcus constellatus subsp. pharyngis SK1060 = CCUG 46377]